MSTTLKLRGGSTAEHGTFTGEAREVTVDTQKNTVVVHDGSTVGGHPLLKVSDIGTASTANIGTGTGEVIGTDEAKEYFGLNFEPSVKPTIASDFSSNDHKLYEQYGLEPKTITQMYDVVRASTATYVDATGRIRTAGVNEPRIDFSSGQGRLLVEEARTNLFRWSEDFSQSVWGKTGVSVSTSTEPSPNALITMTKVNIASSVTSTQIAQSFSAIASTVYTFSFYCKKGSGVDYLIVGGVPSAQWEGSQPLTNFNLNTGMLENSSAEVLNSSVELINDIYRVSISGRTSSNATTADFRIFASDRTAATWSTPTTGSEFFYLWGAQLEQASTPSSYIPTEASAVTRAADNVSRVLGDEFNPSEGAVYFDININSISLDLGEFIHQSDTDYRFLHRFGSSPLLFRVYDGSSGAVLNGSATVGRHKVVVSYKAGMAIAAVDGVITPSFVFNPADFGSVFGVGTRISSGSSSKATDFIKVRYYSKALSDQECIELTKV